MIVMLTLLAAAPATAAPAHATAVKPVCRRTTGYATTERPLRIRRLDQEPPAELLYGVLRLSDGCEDPMVIRRDIGSPAAPDSPAR